MPSERLWAPWRLSYIREGGKSNAPEPETFDFLPGADPECFACRALASEHDRANLVLWRRPHTVTILNRYPYNNGHLLIVPNLHKADLSELSDEEVREMHDSTVRLTAHMRRLMQVAGFNIGLNLGISSGAGVPGHIHWHIVPRWSGDSNFMATVADTRVISQSLDALWELLRKGLAEEEGAA